MDKVYALCNIVDKLLTNFRAFPKREFVYFDVNSGMGRLLLWGSISQNSTLHRMLVSTVTVKNRAGLHTRPAASLVKLAAKYKSEIFLNRDGFSINAKSIIGVMTLAAELGCKLEVTVDGPDEQQAMEDITLFFSSGFGEL